MLSNISINYIFKTVSALNNLWHEYSHIEDPLEIFQYTQINLWNKLKYINYISIQVCSLNNLNNILGDNISNTLLYKPYLPNILLTRH